MPSDTFAAGIEDDDVLTPEEAWDTLLNVDDRTSPEEYPDMCLITRDELFDFIARCQTRALTPTASEATAIGAGEDKYVTLRKVIDADVERLGSFGSSMVRAGLVQSLLRDYDTLAAASPKVASDTAPGVRYRHLKRGTVYEVIGNAELQTADGSLVDGSALVVYRGEDGKLWAREEGEFHDGRFEALAASPTASDTDTAVPGYWLKHGEALWHTQPTAGMDAAEVEK